MYIYIENSKDFGLLDNELEKIYELRETTSSITPKGKLLEATRYYRDAHADVIELTINNRGKRPLCTVWTGSDTLVEDVQDLLRKHNINFDL